MTDEVVRGGVVGRAGPPRLALPRRRHRRGRRPGATVESVNARWGNLMAILAGDFLLARASEIAAALGTEVAGLLAATIGRLCEGQVVELQHAFDVDRTEDDYLRVDRGQDGGAVRHRRAASAPSSAGSPASDRRPHRVRPALRHGVPDRRRRARRRRHRRASSASRPATTWSRASTRCRCSGRCTTDAGAELRTLLGGPLDDGEVEPRQRPRAPVRRRRRGARGRPRFRRRSRGGPGPLRGAPTARGAGRRRPPPADWVLGAGQRSSDGAARRRSEAAACVARERARSSAAGRRWAARAPTSATANVARKARCRADASSQPCESDSATKAPVMPVPSETPSTSLSCSEATARPPGPGAARPRTVTEIGAYARPIPKPATDQTQHGDHTGSGPEAPMHPADADRDEERSPARTSRRGPTRWMRRCWIHAAAGPAERRAGEGHAGHPGRAGRGTSGKVSEHEGVGAEEGEGEDPAHHHRGGHARLRAGPCPGGTRRKNAQDGERGRRPATSTAASGAGRPPSADQHQRRRRGQEHERVARGVSPCGASRRRRRRAPCAPGTGAS